MQDTNTDSDTTAERLEAVDAEQPLDLETAKLEGLRLLQIGGMSFGFLSTVSQLAAAEFVLTIKTLPKVAGVGLFLVPIVYFAWLGLSVLLSWLAYRSAASEMLGFGVFFLLQCALLLLGYRYIKRATRQLGFGQSKTQIAALIETVKHEFKSGRESAQRESV